MENGTLPSTTYLAFPLEDSDSVERLLLDQSIRGNGACWTGTNHSDSSDLRYRHLGGLETTANFLAT